MSRAFPRGPDFLELRDEEEPATCIKGTSEIRVFFFNLEIHVHIAVARFRGTPREGNVCVAYASSLPAAGQHGLAFQRIRKEVAQAGNIFCLDGSVGVVRPLDGTQKRHGKLRVRVSGRGRSAGCPVTELCVLLSPFPGKSASCGVLVMRLAWRPPPFIWLRVTMAEVLNLFDPKVSMPRDMARDGRGPVVRPYGHPGRIVFRCYGSAISLLFRFVPTHAPCLTGFAGIKMLADSRP